MLSDTLYCVFLILNSSRCLYAYINTLPGKVFLQNEIHFHREFQQDIFYTRPCTSYTRWDISWSPLSTHESFWGSAPLQYTKDSLLYYFRIFIDSSCIRTKTSTDTMQSKILRCNYFLIVFSYYRTLDN